MPTPGEGAAGRRLALVVATASYADQTLAKLRAPGRDASDLAAVLEDAGVGGFEVEMVLDAPADSLRRRVAQFCARGGPHDLALVYLSCHGVLDDRGRLYYATVDTDRELLAATAVPSAWLNEQLEDCRCRRQILVLDCCHSGAFAKGAKGEGGLALGERFEGRGRVVLTGSRATEYSFERGHVVGDSASSVFTSALVEGLRSGDADRDRDGKVTVTELYDHAYEVVRGSDAQQTPTLWTYGAEGDLLVAHSPRGAIVEPAPLPEDLVALLESARPRVREGAVAELADLLTGPNAGRALTARAQLERIAVEDVPSVAVAARTALDAEPVPASAPGPVHAHPPRPAEPGAPRPPTDGDHRRTGPPSPPTDGAPQGRTGPPSPRRRATAIAAGAIAIAVVAVAAVALLAGGPEEQASPAPGPDGIAVSGSPRGVAVGEGAVWVARHDDGQVSRIDPATGPESIDVGPTPTKVVAGEGSVWVAIADGRKLARIDPRTHKVTARVTVDIKGCSCEITELEIAQGVLWIGSQQRRAIMTADLRTGEDLAHVYHPGAGFKGVFTVGGGVVWAVGTDDHDPAASWLMRIDPDSDEVERISLGTQSRLDGVAYGQRMVWIADSSDTRNVVTAFDPRTEGTNDVEVDSGITGDDIAVVEGAVLVWNTDDGLLTQIDTDQMRVTATQSIRGYRRHQSVNRTWSDLSVGGGSAWLTDPAGDAVYQTEY